MIIKTEMDRNIISTYVILDFFKQLNENNIIYVIRNNINNELPSHLSVEKDIDILINEICKDDFERIMTSNGYEKIVVYDQRQFLEGSRGNIMWINKQSLLQVHVFYDLCCKGLLLEWNKIGNSIQDRIWIERRWNEEDKFWIMDAETQLVYLISRSVFDKHIFQPGYIAAINQLYSESNKEIVQKYLRIIFGSYTQILMEMISRRNYDMIEEYYSVFERINISALNNKLKNYKDIEKTRCYIAREMANLCDVKKCVNSINRLGLCLIGRCYMDGNLISVYYHVGFGIEIECNNKAYTLDLERNNGLQDQLMLLLNRVEDTEHDIDLRLESIIDKKLAQLDGEIILIVGKGKHTDELLKKKANLNVIDIIDSDEIYKYKGFEGTVIVSTFFYKEEVERKVYETGFTRVFNLYEELLKEDIDLETPFYEIFNKESID